MAFEGQVITLAGLVEVELPGHSLRLSDGGFLDWPGRGLFTSADPAFGVLDSVEAVTEAAGDEAPAGRLTLLPPEGASAASLFQPQAGGSPLRAWLAEVDPETGTIIGSPEMLMNGMVDAVELGIDAGGRSVELDFASAAERLFMISEGNVLSPAFHKSVWPGELGFDHATGAVLAVPWGVPGPPRGATGAEGAAGGGSGGGGFIGVIAH